jgi:hypothetical protein
MRSTPGITVSAKGWTLPDLATVKDFLRFHIATSRGKIVEKPMADSVNTFAEWFFACFTRITNTRPDEDDRSEVYKASALPRDVADTTSQLLVGPENAHRRGSDGEHKEAETQFLRSRSHASSGNPLDQG